MYKLHYMTGFFTAVFNSTYSFKATNVVDGIVELEWRKLHVPVDLSREVVIGEPLWRSGHDADVRLEGHFNDGFGGLLGGHRFLGH